MSTDDELLLRAGRDAGPAGQRRLAALLAATTVPARPGELDGELAALAAFRVACHAPIPRRRNRLYLLKSTLAKLLTVKVGALCAAALSVGGVAVAATTGSLPAALRHDVPSASTSHPAKRPSGLPSTRPSRPATPPPGLLAQCHDYIGKDSDHRRRALDEADFHDLVGQAGGKDRDRVDRFCDKLVHDSLSGGRSELSGGPSEPSGGPSERTGPRPSDNPAEHATGRPVPPSQGGEAQDGPGQIHPSH